MTKLPRLIFNTDGNWMLFYLPDRNPDDVTHQLDELVPAGVDALAGLIGIDDDVVWRGSPHSAMWGDDTEVWDPDPDVDADGKPIRKMTSGGFELNRLEQLHNCMDAVIADGRELMQVYIHGCRRHGIAAIASMRMNDAHTSDEAREWQVRSRHKKSRPDLLIGSPTPTRAGGADREAGLADGRILGTELRLHLTDYEACLDRIFCRVNDRAVSLAGATKLENELGTWLVVKNIPVQRGENLVLIGLNGLQTPDPWPTLHQCEVMVLGCDSA